MTKPQGEQPELPAELIDLVAGAARAHASRSQAIYEALMHIHDAHLHEEDDK